MTFLSVIPILLTLGSHPECDGYGICEVERVVETKLADCDRFENCVLANLDYEDAELILSISQSKIKDKTFIKYFTKEHFEIDRDVIISYEIARELNLPAAILIPKGKYPINEEHGKIVVRFKV